MGNEQWETTLNELESNLAQAQAAIAAGPEDELPNLSWQPPENIGPLDESLAERATELLAELTQTLKQLEHKQAAIGQELSELNDGGSRTSGRSRRNNNANADVPSPRLIDHSA